MRALIEGRLSLWSPAASRRCVYMVYSYNAILCKNERTSGCELVKHHRLGPSHPTIVCRLTIHIVFFVFDNVQSIPEFTSLGDVSEGLYVCLYMRLGSGVCLFASFESIFQSEITELENFKSDAWLACCY